MRRAAPATLTGVSGRPTTAWAGETRLSEYALSGVSDATKSRKSYPASRAIFKIFDRSLCAAYDKVLRHVAEFGQIIVSTFLAFVVFANPKLVAATWVPLFQSQI